MDRMTRLWLNYNEYANLNKCVLTELQNFSAKHLMALALRARC